MTPDHARLFAFESDFVATLRCIPMAVRLKLDTCGIKLTLRQWSRFSSQDRRELLMTACTSPEEIAAYRETLMDLALARAGEVARPLPPLPLSLWDEAQPSSDTVTAYARTLGLTAPTAPKWRALTALQRFALIKLTRDNHDNINFPAAMAEFGMLTDARTARGVLVVR